MPNYYRMNKILEEEGTCETARTEEESYANHEADEFIKKAEDKASELEIQEDE